MAEKDDASSLTCAAIKTDTSQQLEDLRWERNRDLDHEHQLRKCVEKELAVQVVALGDINESSFRGQAPLAEKDRLVNEAQGKLDAMAIKFSTNGARQAEVSPNRSKNQTLTSFRKWHRPLAARIAAALLAPLVQFSSVTNHGAEPCHAVSSQFSSTTFSSVTEHHYVQHDFGVITCANCLGALTP